MTDSVAARGNSGVKVVALAPALFVGLDGLRLQSTRLRVILPLRSSA